MSLAVIDRPTPLQSDSDGVMRVAHTRVSLDTLVSAFRDGATAEEIVQQYPVLCLADVYSVIGYYLAHEAEVQAYLHERERHGEQVRQENEARHDPQGVRDRLLARRGTPG